jgi:hypothetical protein
MKNLKKFSQKILASQNSPQKRSDAGTFPQAFAKNTILAKAWQTDIRALDDKISPKLARCHSLQYLNQFRPWRNSNFP